MTATRRCGTPRLSQPIRRRPPCHAPARHAPGLPTSLVPTAYAGGTVPDRAALITTDSHTKHYYKALTTRTLNIVLCQHPRYSFQTLLAHTLTRLLSEPPGTLACSPDRRSAKRARTLPRSSGAAAACSLNRQHTTAIIPFSPLPSRSHKTALWLSPNKRPSTLCLRCCCCSGQTPPS